jgi:protein-tyrosine-phosphatase
MAEGFARHYGEGLVVAASAGLAPTKQIAPETIEAMAEKGVDIRSQFPKEFDSSLAESFSYVINLSGFDLPPLVHARIFDYDVADPFGKPIDAHRKVRDQIEDLVRRLIDEIDRFGVISASPRGPQIAASTSRRVRLWQRFTRLL